MTENKTVLYKGEHMDSTYEIQFFLARDERGELYALKGSGGKRYLLKLYRSFLFPEELFAGEKLKEEKILSSLEQENLHIPLSGGKLAREGKVYHYLIFPNIGGETLGAKIRRDGAMEPYDALPVMISLGKTLEYLHNRPGKIYHNNIHINSVYLDYREQTAVPVLTSFTFASEGGLLPREVTEDFLNPFYTAPELEESGPSEQTDLFSLGALFYHLITGNPPWALESRGMTNKEIKEAVKARRIRPLFFPPRENPGDNHIESCLLKALALNPGNRFPSCGEFLKALKREIPLKQEYRVARGTPPSSPPPEPSHPGGPGFKAIAGLEELKELLNTEVIKALREPELFKSYGLDIPNGILLYGPPGCGKTFIAEKLAEEAGFSFFAVRPSDLASTFIHGTQEKIGQLFGQAENMAPAILFIDEMDAAVPIRDGQLNHGYASEVNEFLARMTNCAKRGIFLIAASNRPERIDPAVLRTGRIDKMIYVPPPDRSTRAELFRLYLEGRPLEGDMNYSKLGELTPRFVSSDIKFLVDEASRKALKRGIRIKETLLVESIKANKPSVPEKDLLDYETLRERFEKTGNTGSRPIGFTP